MIRPDLYPQSESPSADHQFGSYKDETSVGANDGTGLFKDQVMDLFQPWANLFTKHSITPSNVKEKASVSQVTEALDAELNLTAGNVDTLDANGTYTVEFDNKNGILILESPLTTVTIAGGAGIDDGSRLTVLNNTGGTITLNPGSISILDTERILLFYNSDLTGFDSLLGDNVIAGTIRNTLATDSTSKDNGSVILAGGQGMAKSLVAGLGITAADAIAAKIALRSDGKIATGGETAPDVDPGGICVQLDGGDFPLSFKDVANITHPFTSIAETDTFAMFRHEPGGTLLIRGFHESTNLPGLQFVGYSVDADNATDVNAIAPVMIDAHESDGGTGSQAIATDNLVVIRTGTNARYIFKGDGTAHADVAWAVFSDKRLKEDIKKIPYGLNSVLNMNPVKFKRKLFMDKKNNKYKLFDQIGLIAQELKEIIPECVMGEETETSYLSIDYDRLVPVLVQAIKELKTEINNLKK